MSDLIIEGAKGIPDGLYVIKDGELFKYKAKGGTVRSYHVTGRPKGKWIVRHPKPFFLCECSVCGESEAWMSNFCPNCGSDNRERSEE